MSEKDQCNNKDTEMEASKRRSDRIKEINEDLSKGMDPAMEKLLAEIAERNKTK